MNKKIEKLKKLKKIKLKTPNHEKNRLKFWKNRPVRFWFYKSIIKKTELNPNKKNRAKSVWTGFGLFFLKKFNLIFFLIKIELNWKWWYLTISARMERGKRKGKKEKNRLLDALLSRVKEFVCLIFNIKE
jgi:hypothetical protein